MAKLELMPQVFDDFDRIIDHLQQVDVEDAPSRISEIADALDILTHSPLIGRKTDSGRRELVIGREARGYIALYAFEPTLDTVFVLAVRGQKESGFADER